MDVNKNKDFSSLIELLEAFPDEQSCIDHFTELRWRGDVRSPFKGCENSPIYRCKGNRFKCKQSNKYFTVKTGTIFEETKVPLRKWFIAIYLHTSHKKGISSHQLAKDIKVTQKTAWFMLHRIRYALSHGGLLTAKMGGTTEADETFVGGKEKNKHKINRTEGTQGRSTKTKTPVVGVMQRGGQLRAEVTEDTTQATIERIVDKNVREGSKVMSDEWTGYQGLGKKYEHDKVNHGQEEYVRGEVHTNNIECAWSHFKRMLIGIYHWCSEEHLQKYVDEFAFRYNTRTIGEGDRVNIMMRKAPGKRLTYKKLIAH